MTLLQVDLVSCRLAIDLHVLGPIHTLLLFPLNCASRSCTVKPEGKSGRVDVVKVQKALLTSISIPA
jgi:hypothetical protein